MSTDNGTSEIPIPEREFSDVFCTASLYTTLTRVSSAASVSYNADEDSICLYLGDLRVELPTVVWRDIAAALTELLDAHAGVAE